MPPERRRRLVEFASAEFASEGYEHASLNRIIDIVRHEQEFVLLLPAVEDRTL